MNYRELPLIQLYTYDMHSHGLNWLNLKHHEHWSRCIPETCLALCFVDPFELEKCCRSGKTPVDDYLIHSDPRTIPLIIWLPIVGFLLLLLSVFYVGKRESTYHSISQKRNSELQMLSHCRETTQTTKKQYMVYMQYMYTYKLFLKHIQTPSNTHTQTWSILVTQSPLPRYMNPAFALDLLLPFRWAPVFCETFGVMRSSSHRLGLNGCYYSLKPERILSWLELMIMLGFWIPKKCVESEEWEVPQAYHQGALHYPSILGFASDCNTP